MTNIELFNLHLTCAIGMLYPQHPATIDIGSDDLWKPPLQRSDADYDTKVRQSAGALTWLHRNGFISGRSQQPTEALAIFSAQLSAAGYAIANRVDPNSDGETFGQLAARALASESGSRAERAFSELVAKRFTER